MKDHTENNDPNTQQATPDSSSISVIPGTCYARHYKAGRVRLTARWAVSGFCPCFDFDLEVTDDQVARSALIEGMRGETVADLVRVVLAAYPWLYTAQHHGNLRPLAELQRATPEVTQVEGEEARKS